MLIRPQVKHIRQLAKLCEGYHTMSRFKDESPLEEDNLHDFIKAIITRPTVFFEVLELEDKIHGFIVGALEQQPWNKQYLCSIPFIYLDDCCRGKGWAEQMLDNAKAWAKANNCYEIITSDYAVDPDRTGKWLESIGFEKVGVTYGIKV